MQTQPEPIPLPEIFWSFETGQPIKRCGLCDCNLLEADTPYVIEKAFNNGETIFEHALCLDCHAASVSQMSAESMQRIRAYFSERVDAEKRQLDGLEQFGNDHKRWLAHCMVKGYPASECGEYQVYGFCSRENLIFDVAPYLLSGEVIEEIMELLSSETVDALAEISDRLFGLDAPKDLLVF